MGRSRPDDANEGQGCSISERENVAVRIVMEPSEATS